MARSTSTQESEQRLAHVADLATAERDTWPTRDRILAAAASAMAAKGYHGATTREIADAVGIQQPSIFNHFASKTAIIAELFEYDLVIPCERAVQLSAEGGSPACRLHRYVVWQTNWYHDMPFDLRGLRIEQIDELGLDRPRAALDTWRRTLAGWVDDGLSRRQFHPDASPFLGPAIDALAYEVVRVAPHDGRRPTTTSPAEAAATFVLRAVLRDPSELDDIRAEARRLEAAIG